MADARRYSLSNGEVRELSRWFCRVAIAESTTVSAAIDAIADALLEAPSTFKGKVLISVSSGGTSSEYAMPSGFTALDILGALDAVRYLLGEYATPADALAALDALAAAGRKRVTVMGFNGATV